MAVKLILEAQIGAAKPQYTTLECLCVALSLLGNSYMGLLCGGCSVAKCTEMPVEVYFGNVQDSFKAVTNSCCEVPSQGSCSRAGVAKCLDPLRT